MRILKSSFNAETSKFERQLQATFAECMRAARAELSSESTDREAALGIGAIAVERERVIDAVSMTLQEEGIRGGLKNRIVVRSRNKLQSSAEIADRRVRNRTIAIAGLGLFGLACFTLGLNKPESVACSQEVSLCYLLRFDVWQGER